jgi:hypothetical protein
MPYFLSLKKSPLYNIPFLLSCQVKRSKTHNALAFLEVLGYTKRKQEKDDKGENDGNKIL